MIKLFLDYLKPEFVQPVQWIYSRHVMIDPLLTADISSNVLRWLLHLIWLLSFSFLKYRLTCELILKWSIYVFYFKNQWIIRMENFGLI
jgi:hypothetical protein